MSLPPQAATFTTVTASSTVNSAIGKTANDIDGLCILLTDTARHLNGTVDGDQLTLQM